MSSPSDIVVVKMNFAQNFALLSQHEVQLAHFDKPQATFFAALVAMGIEHKNFVIISDYLEHVRTRLHFFVQHLEKKKPLHLWNTKFECFAQQFLVATIKQITPNDRAVNYVTDGKPSHFKNPYNILNLSFHETDFGIRTIWTLTTTSHGKGSVDGLGAAVKSTATRYLM